jgi:hypothetical protein
MFSVMLAPVTASFQFQVPPTQARRNCREDSMATPNWQLRDS